MRILHPSGSHLRGSQPWQKDRITVAEERIEGHMVLTLDLPGAGANTIAPKSFGARPFDLAAFAAYCRGNAGRAVVRQCVLGQRTIQSCI